MGRMAPAASMPLLTAFTGCVVNVNSIKLNAFLQVAYNLTACTRPSKPCEFGMVTKQKISKFNRNQQFIFQNHRKYISKAEGKSNG